MCNKSVDNYVHTFEFVSDCYKTKKMCNKAVNTSPSAMQCNFSECYKTQEMCVKALDIYLVFDSTSDQYKIQEMSEKAVHNFLIF